MRNERAPIRTRWYHAGTGYIVILIALAAAMVVLAYLE